MEKIIGYLRDESGIETLEWIAIAALVVAMAIVLYPGAIQTALTTVISNIAASLTGI